MMSQIFMVHSGLLPHGGEIWGFVALVLLILFITLVVSDGSKDKDK